MSEATPTSTKKIGGSAWSENEKLGLLFQIIEKAGTIPWAQIDLPEGRTIKACSVMVDKEKAKVRKAKEEARDSVEGTGDSTPATPATGKGKKRAAPTEDPATTPILASGKKARAPRKSKKAIEAEEAAAAEAAEKVEGDDDDDDEEVKAEAFE